VLDWKKEESRAAGITQMVNYFFDLRANGLLPTDEEGCVLPNCGGRSRRGPARVSK
jgi:hypothetical protein